MEFKHVTGIIAALVLGIGLGYVVFNNNSELSQAYSELMAIQTTHNELQSKYETLEAQLTELTLKYETLETEFNSLSEDYEELTQNNVPRPDYEMLNELYLDVQEEKIGLEASFSSLKDQYNELDSMYETLSNQYDALNTEYQLVNGPISIFTDINDLDIILTTEKTIYNYTEPIQGTVSIYYKTGEPFKGSVSFSIKTGSFGYTSGYDHNIIGETEYYVGLPAFRHGPGVYQLRLCYIYDDGGFVIAGYDELQSTSITLEAK